MKCTVFNLNKLNKNLGQNASLIHFNHFTWSFVHLQFCKSSSKKIIISTFAQTWKIGEFPSVEISGRARLRSLVLKSTESYWNALKILETEKTTLFNVFGAFQVLFNTFQCHSIPFKTLDISIPFGFLDMILIFVIFI